VTKVVGVFVAFHCAFTADVAFRGDKILLVATRISFLSTLRWLSNQVNKKLGLRLADSGGKEGDKQVPVQFPVRGLPQYPFPVGHLLLHLKIFW
jgi:hypothetical protein